MTSAAAEPAVVMRTPRWVLAILFVSLAFNLLIIGLVAGSAWRYSRFGPPAGWGPPTLLNYSMSLDRTRRAALREAAEPMRQALRPLRREISQARNDVAAAISAQPFDQARFEAAQAHLIALEIKAREEAQALYAQIVKNMTDQERAGFAHWREHRRWRGPSFFDETDARERPMHR